MFDVTCKIDGIRGVISNECLLVQSVKDKKAGYGAIQLMIANEGTSIKSITVDGFELAQAISNCQRNEGRRLIPSYYRPRYNDDSEESEE